MYIGIIVVIYLTIRVTRSRDASRVLRLPCHSPLHSSSSTRCFLFETTAVNQRTTALGACVSFISFPGGSSCCTGGVQSHPLTCLSLLCSGLLDAKPPDLSHSYIDIGIQWASRFYRILLYCVFLRHTYKNKSTLLYAYSVPVGNLGDVDCTSSCRWS